MSLRRTLRRGGNLVATSGPARVGAAVVRKGSGAVSTPSDALRDFAALGQLGLIARPSVFDRLRLGRGEALAEPLGAARSIKRCLGVALEPRHHLARDQFVMRNVADGLAQLCANRR